MKMRVDTEYGRAQARVRLYKRLLDFPEVAKQHCPKAFAKGLAYRLADNTDAALDGDGVRVPLYERLLKFPEVTKQDHPEAFATALAYWLADSMGHAFDRDWARKHLCERLLEFSWVSEQDQPQSFATALADLLVDSVCHARAVGAPPIEPRVHRKRATEKTEVTPAPQATVPRATVTAREILATDITAALKALEVHPGRWRQDGEDGQGGALMDVLTLAWEVATGQKFFDQRRVAKADRQWTVDSGNPTNMPGWKPPPGWKSSPGWEP